MKPRPKCPVCGKGIGRRASFIEEQHIPIGATPVWRPSNEIVLKEWSHPYGIETKHMRILWDGESFYLPTSKPFCGSTCAFRFARAAYNNGWRGQL